MTDEEIAIWNRAVNEKGGALPRRGDKALGALMAAHGLVMNGGVLHAVQALDKTELAEAITGFRLFGFDNVATLLETAAGSAGGEQDEEDFNARYAEEIPDDGVLTERLHLYFGEHPDWFAPVQ